MHSSCIGMVVILSAILQFSLTKLLIIDYYRTHYPIRLRQLWVIEILFFLRGRRCDFRRSGILPSSHFLCFLCLQVPRRQALVGNVACSKAGSYPGKSSHTFLEAKYHSVQPIATSSQLPQPCSNSVNQRNELGLLFGMSISLHFHLVSHIRLLIQAFTHPSVTQGIDVLDVGTNRRLEFLGDSVLQLIVSRYLWVHFPESQEGYLTVQFVSSACSWSS